MDPPSACNGLLCAHNRQKTLKELSGPIQMSLVVTFDISHQLARYRYSAGTVRTHKLQKMLLRKQYLYTL